MDETTTASGVSGGTQAQLPTRAEARRRGFLRTEARGFLDALWATLPADVARCSTGIQIGEQAKYVSWELPEDLPRIEVLLMTDVQFGHVFCRYERVTEFRDWILAEPYRFVLWGGDIVDAGHMFSPGTTFEQMGDPQSQVMRCAQFWAPMRHRILASVGGNHERRAVPMFGDLGTLIATFLRLPYSAGRQLVDLYYGKHAPFKIDLWHGTGGARTKGGIAQALERYVQRSSGQFCGMGHLHQALMMFMWREVRDSRRRNIRLEKVVGALGTSFLDYFGTYGEVKGFAAHDVLMPRVVLDREGGWEVTVK